jgi:hypothetical protein
MKYSIIISLFTLATAILLISCSSTNTLTVQDARQYQSVKIFLMSGESENGILINNDLNTLVYISENSHEKKTVDYEDVVRIEKLDVVYDFQAYPISKAEINKVKSSRSTWGYAIGGAVVGAAAGLGVGLIFWDKVPPSIFAGTGAVLGSIYFAFRGQNKDKENAIEQIRYMRLSESDLQQQVDEEKKKLEELEKEKKKMHEQLKKKNK